MIDEDGNDGALDLHLIDFEYAAPNYAAYDIGNHFYEMAGFECNWEDFPTIEQQVAAITTATWFIRNSTVSFSSFFTYSFFFSFCLSVWYIAAAMDTTLPREWMY